MSHPKILVIGGGGFYGRYLVADLLKNTEAEIIVASRNPPNAWPDPRVRTVPCDLHDLASLERVMAGCQVVAHCAGPFQHLPLNPLRAAIHTHTHYVDIAEDRHYYQAVRALAAPIAQAGIAVFAGMSVSPAMEALFAAMFRPRFDTLTSLRTFAAPDTRKHRGPAMFATMLMGVGRPFLQPKNGMLRKVHGWTEPEWVTFPPPVGRRLTHLVLEMANLDLLPDLLGLQTVEFKAGTEWVFLNVLLNTAARLRATTGFPPWEVFTPLVRAMSWLVGRVGKDEGGVIFEMQGRKDNVPSTQRIALMARHDGGLIPSVLAGIATAQLLTGNFAPRGLIPVHNWISPTTLLTTLLARGLEIWWQPTATAPWQPLTTAEAFF